ncbi:hypothetical protein HQ531_05540 [bacterium]|nr:hypothetical protein [bacterium]
MRRVLSIILILTVSMIYAQDASPEYIGNKKCKMCHNKAAKGAQYDKWETTAHAKTFEILLSDEAIAIGKKMGLANTPDKEGECLQCHVTGWGTPTGYQLEVDAADKKAVSKNDALKNVGCEACHGPGSLYKGKKAMLAISAGQTEAASLGLVYPNEKTCLACHNEKSPTAKPFVFKEHVTEITHPYPEQ